jgi:hypothetical protein
MNDLPPLSPRLFLLTTWDSIHSFHSLDVTEMMTRSNWKNGGVHTNVRKQIPRYRLFNAKNRPFRMNSLLVFGVFTKSNHFFTIQKMDANPISERHYFLQHKKKKICKFFFSFINPKNLLTKYNIVSRFNNIIVYHHDENHCCKESFRSCCQA